jgi:tetratricopeptide (TPR) repeat protein
VIPARALLLVSALAVADAADADRAFRRGDHEAAVRGYERAIASGDASPALRYNLGTALIRLGREDEALVHLEAVAGGADPRLRLLAAYNAGYAALAPVAGGRAGAERTERLERAIGHLRAVLLADPADADARWNLELAERLLRRDEPANGGGAGEGGGGDGGGDGAAAGGGGSADPAPGPLDVAEAERILAGAERRDQAVQRGRLRAGTTAPAGGRDW